MLFKRCALALLLVFIAADSAAQPSRWVSLNQCVDQLLLRWAPQQLAGVTYLSESELLLKQPQAAHIGTHSGTLESVLALRPTRVIATPFSNPDLVRRLQEYTEVTVLPQPQSWTEYQQWLQTLRTLGLHERVSEHAETTQRRLGQLARQPQQVIFVMPNQWSWGEGTWADTLIQQAGWQNLAAQLGSGLVALQLEQLLQWQAEHVVLEGFSQHSFALANSWQHHPLLRRWLQQQRVTIIDSDTAACPVVNIGRYLSALEQMQ